MSEDGLEDPRVHEVSSIDIVSDTDSATSNPTSNLENAEVRIANPEDENDDTSREAMERGRHAAELLEDHGDGEKQYLELDMVNYTLVRCTKDTDGDQSPEYELIASNQVDVNGENGAADETLYVLQQPEAEATDSTSETHYVVLNESEPEQPPARQPSEPLYVVRYADEQEECVEGDASAALLARVVHVDPGSYRQHFNKESPGKVDGRKRNTFPNAQTLLASPNFKLFLYTCKLCEFRCNAIQELRDHKKTQHPARPAARTWRQTGGEERPGKLPRLQHACPRCSHSAASREDLKNHFARHHPNSEPNSGDEQDLSSYQCDICNFECSDSRTFNRHADTHLTA